MGIFDRFPSTKLNDINLDWILKKIRSLRGGAANQVLAKASDTDFDFKWISEGGGGTSDYNELVNRPQINDVTLAGNLTASDLGLLDASALGSYRTASAQDTIDAGKQSKIAVSGILKGDGNGGVSAAAEGVDYLAPSALNSYRAASAQDDIDAAQDANIGIVITGARPSMAVSTGQYVIVRDSTISGVTDGLYVNSSGGELSPSTDVTSADLTAVSGGGLNDLNSVVSNKNKLAKHLFEGQTIMILGQIITNHAYGIAYVPLPIGCLPVSVEIPYLSVPGGVEWFNQTPSTIRAGMLEITNSDFMNYNGFEVFASIIMHF